MLEEDIALSNLALDLIGQARALYDHACTLDGGTLTEDDLAFRRIEPDFRNVLLVEQDNGNFADTMVRHLFFAVYAQAFYQALRASNDETVAGIADRSAREMAYHVRHAAEWVIRLGDGTPESHDKAEAAVNELWYFIDELFETDDLDRAMAAKGFGVTTEGLRSAFMDAVTPVLSEATLSIPTIAGGVSGGRHGHHSEHMGHLLAEMQYLPRAYPDAVW